MTCVQVVIFDPPMPPSATYRYPSGPNFNPLGLLKPEENLDALITRLSGLQLHNSGPFFLQEENSPKMIIADAKRK